MQLDNATVKSWIEDFRREGRISWRLIDQITVRERLQVNQCPTICVCLYRCTYSHGQIETQFVPMVTKSPIALGTLEFSFCSDTEEIQTCETSILAFRVDFNFFIDISKNLHLQKAISVRKDNAFVISLLSDNSIYWSLVSINSPNIWALSVSLCILYRLVKPPTIAQPDGAYDFWQVLPNNTADCCKFNQCFLIFFRFQISNYLRLGTNE